MNVVFVYKDGTIVTPESESILEGITRDSILQLAMDRGHKVERPRGLARRVARRAWHPATSSRCSPAARPRSSRRSALLKGEDFVDRHSSGRSAELALSLREELTDIQYGRRRGPATAG